MKRELNKYKGILLILFCLLLATNMGAQSQSQGKKISFQCEKEKLHKALDEVERQSGYYRMQYVMEDVNPYTVTNVKLQNVTVESAVKRLLSGTPLKYEIKGRFVQVFNPNAAQKFRPSGRSIRGSVFDEAGEPLIGVTVRVKGSSEGTVTDFDGAFSLPANGSGDVTLLFTYVGKKDVEKQANARKTLNVVMEDNSKLLDDVVVTGYQTLSKERVTGSFDKVNQELLASRPTADLSSALQGVVAGMQATENEDGTVDFLIRGTSSLYANTAPLVVVDGFPIEGSFSTINPNDVESVTVLKDAAAASIWGARSANGVIVVTTKKGQQGKLKVDVQGFYRFGTTPDLDYIMAQADSKTTVDYEIMALENEWSLSDFTPTSENIASPLSLAQDYYYAHKYYGMSESEMNKNLDILRNRSNRSQLKKYLMQTQALQQYNASLSAGTDKYSTYASLMYEKNDEATIKRGYERFMLNFNNSYKLNSWLTASVAGTFQRKTHETSGVTISDFTSLSPYEMLVEEDGSYAYNEKSWNKLVADNLNLQNLPYTDLSYNMLQEVRNRSYMTKSTNYRVSLGLNAKIWRNLVFDTKYQYEKYESNVRNYDNEETDYVRQLVNYYTSYDLDNDVLYEQYIPSGGIIRRSKSATDSYVWRNQLSYNETFGKHDITALAGFEISEYKTSSTSYPYVLGYDEKSNTSQAAYYGSKEYGATITGYPDWYSTLASLVSNSFSDRVDRYFSYFGNASYVYDGKYGASFSIRSDGSNYVTEDKSLRWSPMWSVGAKWNLDKEKFMESTSSWLDRLTLRLTYGINGNTEKSTSPQTLISTRANTTTGTNVSYISSYGNPMLRWEETYTTNVGVDFSLFKGLLSGKVEYYNRLGKYIVGTVTVPYVYGSETQKYNNAEILNRGVEVELTGRGKINSIGLGINSTVTFAYNKNVVQKLYYPSLYCYQLCYASNPSNGYFVEGKPVGAVYSYEYAGVRDGVPHVKTADGQEWSFNDLTLHNRTLGLDKMTYSGTSISPYTFGWANQFTWKNFDLYVYMTGKFGGVFRDPTTQEIPLANYKNYFSKYISKVMDSDGTDYPCLPVAGDYQCYRWSRYLPYLQSDIQDASFVRLKEVSLTYHVPVQWLRKVNLSGAKVFVQARDLGLIYTANKHHYDPEWLPGTNKPTTTITFGAGFTL